MAIEKIEFVNGTAKPGDSLQNKIATWSEGCAYIRRIGNALKATGMFDDNHISYTEPDMPTENTSFGSPTDYKANFSIDVDGTSVYLFSIGPHKWVNSGGTNTSTVYTIGLDLTFKYGSGAYDATVTSYNGAVSVQADSCINVAYVTSNGVLFDAAMARASTGDKLPTRKTYLMIAKSNTKYPMIIMSSTGSYQQVGLGVDAHQGVVIANYEDGSYITTRQTTSPTNVMKDYFFFHTSIKQSVLVPFAGVGGADKFTYSPKAFWIPIAPTAIRDGGLQKMHIDGRNMVTDGYWALADG